MVTILKYLVFFILIGCDSICEPGSNCENFRSKREREWNETCRDQSSLLATTSGSPSYTECPNKHHRMKVQVATHPSNEEAAALVFCQCVIDGGTK